MTQQLSALLLMIVSLRWTPIHGETAVLCHGCHLQARGWRHIVIGDRRRHLLGRAPLALRLALAENASLLIFGTGASEGATLFGGREKEATRTLRVLRQQICRLPRDFPSWFGSVAPLECERLLDERSHIDTDSIDTRSEVAAALALCAERGVDRLICVSSPSHLPRCLRDANAALDKMRTGDGVGPAPPPKLLLLGAASQTSYSGSSAAEVVVIEPPHRGDHDHTRDALPLHQLAARCLRVRDRESLFREGLDRLLADHGA